MARPKLPLLTRISNGLRDDTIDPMAIEDTRCWLWQGSLNSSGYPHLINSPPPHRVLFELHVRTQPGMEDYVLPTVDLKDSTLYLRYPFLADDNSRIANLVHNKPTCGEKTCINPYHRDWKGKLYAKPPDWNPKTDDPKHLREPVPPLPTSNDTCTDTATPAAMDKVADWFEPKELEQPFDVLLADLEANWPEFSTDELRDALTEVLKCQKS